MRTASHSCRAAWLLTSAALLVAAAPPTASACSICRCGDPAFNALGLNLNDQGSWRLALDWDRLAKEQASAEEEGVSESVVEKRVTATVSYTPAERLTLMLRVPYTTRELDTHPAEGGAMALHLDGAESTTGRGLSDPEVYALVRLWASPFASGIGRRAWAGLQLGVKTPWGTNDLRDEGERLDEHVQPGTGSTDWIAGVAGVYVLDPVSSVFGSVQYRRTGANGSGYRYGTVALANLGYERTLGRAVDAVLELNGRSTGKDRLDASGVRDPNTGGALVYVTPKLMLRLSGVLVARLSAQIPAVRSLNGVQTEHTVWSAGLTFVSGS